MFANSVLKRVHLRVLITPIYLRMLIMLEYFAHMFSHPTHHFRLLMRTHALKMEQGVGQFTHSQTMTFVSDSSALRFYVIHRFTDVVRRFCCCFPGVMFHPTPRGGANAQRLFPRRANKIFSMLPKPVETQPGAINISLVRQFSGQHVSLRDFGSSQYNYPTDSNNAPDHF